MLIAQAASADPSFFELLQSVDQGALAAVMIIATVGTFATLIVGVATISSTIKNVATTRMKLSMTKELLSKGYSVDDVDRLVNGRPLGKQFQDMVRTARNRFQDSTPKNNPTMPPVKQPA